MAKFLVSPPVLGDEHRRYLARILYVLLGFALGNSLILFSRALVQPELTGRVFGFGGFALLVNLGLLALTRMGRVRLVSWLAVSVYWVCVQVAIVSAGGLQANTLMGLLTLTVFTGLLFGIRGGLTMGGVNILAVFAHAFAESQGWLRTPKIMVLPGVLAIETAYQMASVATLLAVATRFVRDALDRAHREVAERKRSEEALVSSQQKLLDISGNLPGIVYEFVIKPDGSIVTSFLSGRTQEITGLDSRTEGFSERFLAQMSARDQERLREAFREAAAHSKPLTFTGEYTKPSGETMWFDINASPRQQGSDVVLCGVLLDVTERKKAEAALLQSEKDYRTVFNATSDALLVYDLEAGRLVDVNLAMLKLYNLASKEEAMACSATELSANEPPYTETKALRHLQRAIENGLDTYEWRARKKTGELFWAEIATRCFEMNGRHRLVASVRDITERKRNEEELRRSESRLEAAQAHARIGSWELQADATRATWSPQMFRLFDLDPAMQPPSSDEFMELVHPEDRDATRQAFDQARRSAGLVSTEYRTNPARGPVRVLSANIVVHRDAAGRVLYTMGTLQDVTERRLAEESLRTSEERFRLLVESSPDAVLVQREGRIIYANPAMLKLLGAGKPEEVIGLHFMECVAPEFHETVRERIRRMQGNREPVPLIEQVFLRLDGSRVPVETTSVTVSLEGRDAHLAIIRDITERKQAEAELNQERDFSQTLVRSSPGYFVAVGMDGRILMMNESMLSALGYTAEEVVSRDYVTTCIPERERTVAAAFFREIGTSKQASRSEYHVLAKDGRELLVEWHERCVWKSGVPDYMLGVGIDVTERRQAEVRIRQQAALLAASHDAILVWEPATGVRYMNPAAEALADRSFGQAQAQDLFTVLRPQSELELRAAIQEVTEHGEWRGELTLLTGDNKTRTVASRWTALKNAEGESTSVLITCNDITEQKRLESQYLRIQRLESVGTLASGVAHDLNNILTPILMGVELLVPQTANEDTRVVLGMMKDSAGRGVDIVKQLLTFARGADAQKGPVQPRHLLKEIVRLLQQTFPKNIQIYADYSGQPAAVLADPSQIHQVLMNLCVNARDAMPDGGVMYLTLENRTLDDAGVRIHPKARPIPYVVFKVSDSGTGIPADVLDRIFDPFFTTKPQGKGTGLGLATVLGIVENHGGFVTVESKVGWGTTFQVFLPASMSAERPGDESDTATVPHGQGESVLVVDDEPAILHLAAQILQRGGYMTLLATNASEALHFCEQRPDHVQAVVTDIMMPFGDGRHLIEMLHQKHPTLPIIAMSGLATSEFQQETLKRGAQAFVRKPFAAEELLRRLADVLRKNPC